MLVTVERVMDYLQQCNRQSGVVLTNEEVGDREEVVSLESMLAQFAEMDEGR